ncbi:ROK family protein [Candidatus Obscuribacterales bacterium]|nr:ROK family protein [Candidatus Obscuribacterales bacterium]MBX3137350.1 ROK family protein [Candidatus Obscuribacterales bacterium]MBX3152952.1 ROK family protein [Candidatus Obscuribacterales bacterium]
MGDSYAIGIDFGGTKVLAGVVNTKTGELVATSKKKTKQASEQQQLLRKLTIVIEEAVEQAGINFDKIKSIGIGVAGMVDRERGILLSGVNIGASNLKIAEPLIDHYGIPVKLGNDVEVATLGEMHFGAGKKCNNLICVFVGTGIGSGIVHDGAIYHGQTGTAGEIGHTILFPDGRLCNCGGHGCLEAYASRMAIARQVVAGIKRGVDTSVAGEIDENKGLLRSRTLSQAVLDGDNLVTRSVIHAAKFLGVGLASVVNFYNPERIILGGGLVEEVGLYFDVAVEELQHRALPIPGAAINVKKAKLGDFAGIIGAAMLAQNSSDN